MEWTQSVKVITEYDRYHFNETLFCSWLVVVDWLFLIRDRCDVGPLTASILRPAAFQPQT